MRAECPPLVLLLAAAAAHAATLTVTIRDAGTGKPTAAAVGLYDSAGKLLIPDAALDLAPMGYLYRPGALIHYADWSSTRVRSADPFFGSSWFRSRHPAGTACFFVDGGFPIQLEPGRYRLTVRKGMEYNPVERAVDLTGDTVLTLDLSRWVDMAARGWYSGDGHVHIERTGPQADGIALLWAAAEDVRLVNVLAMGDAEETFYPQYSYQPVCRDGRCIVAGQEDPRSRYLGHTLQLGASAFVRNPSLYYSYQPVFEAVRRSGGLSGFAHAGRRRWHFEVDRGLSLLAPFGVVDFAEIAQMGYIGVGLWYEFLNLGFHLTAMAGSDVPWGGTIGQTRVYALTGERFDPKRWLDAVRGGHTFVTTGPMLELTVNGQPPGSRIAAHKHDRIQVVASAWGGPQGSVPVRLELISFGRVLKSVTGAGRLRVSLDLQPEASLWITARCDTGSSPLMDMPGYFAGAIATPVYVELDGRPACDRERLEDLLRRRRTSLEAMGEWLAGGPDQIDPGSAGGRESRAAFSASRSSLYRLLQSALARYDAMLPAE